MKPWLQTILLLSPLALFFFWGRIEVFIIDATVVMVFMIYVCILLVYTLNNVGIIMSPHVIYDGGQFSTAMTRPFEWGEYACLWDGMKYPVNFSFKKKFVAFHRDAYSMVGENVVLNVVPIKWDYESLPADMKQVFKHFAISEDAEILFGVASREYMQVVPEISRLMRLLGNANDEIQQSYTYARAKIEKMDEILRWLANVQKYGSNNGALANIMDKIREGFKDKPDL